MLLYFREKLKNPGKARFSNAELSQILSVYGEHVKRGEWRDYAIDSLSEMAVFSVFKSSKEAPIFTIAKIPSRSFLKPAQYVVYAGDKTLKSSSSLSEALSVFAKED